MQQPFLLGPDEHFVQCPYERSHLISNQRFLWHLDKCRRNYVKKMVLEGKEADIVHCRFNAAHRYPKIEMSYHETNCKDQYAVVKHIQNMQQAGKEDTKRKSTEDQEKPKPKSVPNKEEVDPTEENWDDDNTTQQTCRPGYCPLEKLRTERILYIPRGLTPSERKKWRLQNREKFVTKEEVKEEEYSYEDDKYDGYGRRISPDKQASSSKREVHDHKIRKVEY